MEYSVTGLSLGSGVHGSVDVVSWGEEEVAEGVTGRLLADRTADEHSEASPFPHAAMELVVELVVRVETWLEASSVSIRSVAGGASVVLSSSSTWVLAVGTLGDNEDVEESGDGSKPSVLFVIHPDTVPPVGSTSCVVETAVNPKKVVFEIVCSVVGSSS